MQRPSKTRRKQESHELQALGEALLELADDRARRRSASASRCSTRSLPARRIAQPRGAAPPDAVHRQADALGRRRAGARRASPSAQLGRARDSLALHQAERWRAELIADDDGDDALRRRATPAPTCSSCAALVRNARKDAAAAPEKRSGRAYRELFQFIREREADA